MTSHRLIISFDDNSVMFLTQEPSAIITCYLLLVIKPLLELDYPVKITPKQCIIRAPICSRYGKIIFDLEIRLLT